MFWIFFNVDISLCEICYIIFFELSYFLIWFEYFIFYFIFWNDFDLTNKKIFNNYKEDRTNRLEKENNIKEMSI